MVFGVRHAHIKSGMCMMEEGRRGQRLSSMFDCTSIQPKHKTTTHLLHFWRNCWCWIWRQRLYLCCCCGCGSLRWYCSNSGGNRGSGLCRGRFNNFLCRCDERGWRGGIAGGGSRWYALAIVAVAWQQRWWCRCCRRNLCVLAITLICCCRCSGDICCCWLLLMMAFGFITCCFVWRRRR